MLRARCDRRSSCRALKGSPALSQDEDAKKGPASGSKLKPLPFCGSSARACVCRSSTRPHLPAELCKLREVKLTVLAQLGFHRLIPACLASLHRASESGTARSSIEACQCESCAIDNMGKRPCLKLEATCQPHHLHLREHGGLSGNSPEMLCYSQEEFILLLSSSFLAVMVGLGTSAKHSMTLLDCIACVAAWDQHATGN